jgi:hypothetical protein
MFSGIFGGIFGKIEGPDALTSRQTFGIIAKQLGIAPIATPKRRLSRAYGKGYLPTN